MSRVAVVGGGLAGLSAACALADQGVQVSLFEQRPFLGGRASSYEHNGETIDNCQHVLLGCCTNLIEFYRRIGVEGQIRWYDRLTFMLPGGEAFELKPSLVPAPLHAAPSFLRARGLSVGDKLAVARAMRKLARPVAETAMTFAEWLRNEGQTPAAISRFWTPVLVSALNEELDRVSAASAAMVFREAFLKSPQAGRMGVSAVPLGALYAPAADYIRDRGGDVRTRTSVQRITLTDADVAIEADDKSTFDAVVLAVPFGKAAAMLPTSDGFASVRGELARFEPSPITGVHLWFDREVTRLDHAVLLDRTIQWMFNKSRILAGKDQESGSYLELVISASHALLKKSREEIIDIALRELGQFFPEARSARVVRATVIKEVNATFSPLPGLQRPTARTSDPRVFLAGDWTDTGWPATMEGAVRSGYLAAQAITGKVVLAPDLAPAGLMRLIR